MIKNFNRLNRKANGDIIDKNVRSGCRDIWNAFMVKGATFTENDIPLCPTTATELPHAVITWEEAKSIYKKHRIKKDTDFKNNAYVCWYIDDYKFDGPRGIWHDYNFAIKVLCHFAGVITPDFSTYQDFPEPWKFLTHTVCEHTDFGSAKTISPLLTMCGGVHPNPTNIALTVSPKIALWQLALVAAVRVSILTASVLRKDLIYLLTDCILIQLSSMVQQIMIALKS